MNSNLIIPDVIMVGFQKREDTFTGHLGYVTMIDDKGVHRKKDSWEGWRDKAIEPMKIDNKPTNGFNFNKGVQRYGYHGSGRSMVRVHDERGFEFEVSVDNALGIMMNTDVLKREIQGECVYAWQGKDLILLPVNSEEYRSAIEFTQRQRKKFSARDLKKGHTYSLKRSAEEMVYIGYYHYFDHSFWENKTLVRAKGKKHIFYNTASSSFETLTAQTIAECIHDEVCENFADLVDQFETSHEAVPIKDVFFREDKDPTVLTDLINNEIDYIMGLAFIAKINDAPHRVYINLRSMNRQGDTYHIHRCDIERIQLQKGFNDDYNCDVYGFFHHRSGDHGYRPYRHVFDQFKKLTDKHDFEFNKDYHCIIIERKKLIELISSLNHLKMVFIDENGVEFDNRGKPIEG